VQIHVKGTPITSVDEWLRLAPPKGGERHWQDGHSAKELARAWFPRGGFPTIPVELRHLLEDHPDTRGAVIQEGTPEHRVHIDRVRGEQHNLDLTLLAHTKHGRLAITIEAKAGEPFGPTVHAVLARAEQRASHTLRPHTAQHHLLAALFGRDDATVQGLRYQLLTSTGGALAYAHEQRAKAAIFIVHEFATASKHDEDLARFIAVLTKGERASIEVGALIGPILLPGAPIIPAPIPLFVGRIRHAHA
jgi:uncharacterized protein DUF6946